MHPKITQSTTLVKIKQNKQKIRTKYKKPQLHYSMIKDYNQHAEICDSGVGVHPQNVDLTEEAAGVDLLVTKYKVTKCRYLIFIT